MTGEGIVSRWKCFHITLSIALRDMWVSSSVGAAYTEIFSIIAQIQIVYVENFSLMASRRRRPSDGFR
jgi:hypothetical protein